ncbi:hypothetical protein [Streptomyces sp. NPDC089919]|uniref:hypothetical protein n=1 Tax=Streptomyces sp. NPDC089919 TaxID=3155188 RepID=UPI003443E2A8
MTLDDLYTDIVAEELDGGAEPERLPVLTHREAALAVAVLDAVAEGGGASDELRATARALTTRLAMRLPST